MKAIIRMAICGWLLTGAALVHGRVFNVSDYGAVADDKTDNTAAFSKCLNAIIADGGGQMVLPAGVYNVQASKPTHGTSGVITPACNNAALTILRNVVVTGYYTGILVNEHTDGDNLNLASNINNWVVLGGVGAVEKFTRNGGATIRSRRIGAAP